ncbi:alkaline phosphatase, tissue-nonspecific isozyme-like [Sabethes cyaneus]|uniref:alkaline phosphatase, tissue-nonspecific isozyme-like n=1 Tax=Sabethes cyaneus TaxID=53552 RepID=UPI00237EB76E|nr:alkaline phosphatase, tissue-nonspecific isozyme-like [Sabethes cyaneus]
MNALSANTLARVSPAPTPPPIPYPTHPMDDPEWQPPQGPMAELDKQYWINSGQLLLQEQLSKNQLNQGVAKNLIIFIADGMSITTQTATRVFMGGEQMQLSFEQFPYVGLAKTYCINYQVSDSGCTASAILTGVKNNYGTIAVSGHVPLMNCERSLVNENRLTSILKYAQEDGRATGIVTNTRLTHATPAVAYAVSGARYWEDDGETPSGCVDIAKQLIYGEIGTNLTVAMGGGTRHFYPAGMTDVHGGPGRRQDGRVLPEEWLQEISKRGERGKYVYDRHQLLNTNVREVDRLLGLFAANHLSYRLENVDQQPRLEEMTAKALEMLQKNERGYVLVVEGGLIDPAHHANQARRALDETVEFHRAVQYAARNTDERDTLIVVTADHSHTLTMGGYPVRGNDILATGDFSRLDRMPFFTLTYANGPSFFEHFPPDRSGRVNPLLMNWRSSDFGYPGAVPYEDETHGGDDVAVFARGPYAHLFTGSYEQHFIGHATLYASCLGTNEMQRSEACWNRLQGSASSVSKSSILISASLLLLFILFQIQFQVINKLLF